MASARGLYGASGDGRHQSCCEEVAALFAQLDGQDTGLAKNVFNAALKARVVLFQRQHNLEDDGVVGVRTLLKLNEQLGIDMTGDKARTRLEGNAPAGLSL